MLSLRRRAHCVALLSSIVFGLSAPAFVTIEFADGGGPLHCNVFKNATPVEQPPGNKVRGVSAVVVRKGRSLLLGNGSEFSSEPESKSFGHLFFSAYPKVSAPSRLESCTEFTKPDSLCIRLMGTPKNHRSPPA